MALVVGNTSVRGEGVGIDSRATKNGATVVADAGGQFGEATSRGEVFTVMGAVVGTTIVAAHVSPIAGAAATPLSLYNPIGSGKNLEVLKAHLLPISGTPGVGSFVWNIAYNQTITATPNNMAVAAALPVCNLPGASVSVAKGYTATALTGSTAQVAIGPITTFFGGAIAATTPITPDVVVDGMIVVPPGGLLSIAAPATGTTFVIGLGITYREVAI